MTEHTSELRQVLDHVRRRWRMKHALRGGVIVVGTAITAFLVTALIVQQAGFAAGPVLGARAFSYVLILVLLLWFVARPLVRNANDERVAMYLEEHEPSLREIVISALEVEKNPAEAGALGRHIVQRAVERCRALDDGRAIDRAELKRLGGTFAGVAAIALALLLLNTPWLQSGRAALLHPLMPGRQAEKEMISVEPGNATIPRGADASIKASLQNFNAGDAELVIRTGADSSFTRIPMLAGKDSATFEAMLFDVADKTEYFIESGGIRSAVYTLDVADIPYVKTLDLDYDFPTYTHLPSQHVDDGGDIAGPAGTMVTIVAHTTLPAAGGRIMLSDGHSVEMQLHADGTLSGAIRIDANGLYSIELRTKEGKRIKGSSEYTIDVLEDHPPTVVFSKPGRDSRQTSVDEVFLEAKADDDYGVAKLELVYSVNGAPDKTIELFSADPIAEVTAGHTVYLEEMKLVPGDVVSYYARANDNGTKGQSATSDIYFMTIRPYSQNYRQSESAAQPPGQPQDGQQQDEQLGDLSTQQRDIIAATFNILRDSTRYDRSKYAEAVNTIALMQDRLRDKVNQLTTRMKDRGITQQDTSFAQIAAILPKALAEMTAALDSLHAIRARPSLPSEQRALQNLLRAEAVYRDIMVQLQQQQQQAGGGGGGQQQPRAQDLADLFELDKAELQNQYETVQRAAQASQQQQQDKAVDEAAERMKELSRRLQQESERMQRQLGAMQNQGGAQGNSSARRMADSLEAAARQLEKLSRDSQPLQQAAREMQQAADNLRRSAATGQSAAATQSAAQQLQESLRRLNRERTGSAADQAKLAADKAQQVVQQQKEIARKSEEFARNGQLNSEQAKQLDQDKQKEAADIASLERELDRLANATRKTDQNASRKMLEAANQVREDQVKEKVTWSRQFTRQQVSTDFARQFEGQVTDDLNKLRERVQQAANSFTPQNGTGDQMSRALELVRALESMRRRTEDEARPGQQQGQRGNGGGKPGDSNAQRDGNQQMMSGGGVVAPMGRLSAESSRQMRAEATQRLQEAGALRREMTASGRTAQDVRDLDAAINGMRQLAGSGAYRNAEELARIQQDVVAGVARFEFGLRRSILGEDTEKVFLPGGGEVPNGFRSLVDAYFRSLSKKPADGGK